MGLLTAMEIVPFVLFSLPSGVWLDRVKKLPVYVAGEALLASRWPACRSRGGWAGSRWLAVCRRLLHRHRVHRRPAARAQIVLTQVVARDRLVEAHAKNALATSGAEVAGRAWRGRSSSSSAPRWRCSWTPPACCSRRPSCAASDPRGRSPRADAAFWRDLRAGVRFVARQQLLVALALAVGVWQMCHHAAIVVQILFATRTLGLSEQAVGLCYAGMGVGTIIASVLATASAAAGARALPRRRLRHVRRRLVPARGGRRPMRGASRRSR
jgi:hypothetical protein